MIITASCLDQIIDPFTTIVVTAVLTLDSQPQLSYHDLKSANVGNVGNHRN